MSVLNSWFISPPHLSSLTLRLLSVEHIVMYSSICFIYSSNNLSRFFSSVVCFFLAKLCPTVCNTMDCSTPGFHVLHHLPGFAQTCFHWVSDAIQPSHSLLPSSPTASVLPSIRGFPSDFASGGQNIGASGSTSVPLMNIQDWFPWGWTVLLFPNCSSLVSASSPFPD